MSEINIDFKIEEWHNFPVLGNNNTDIESVHWDCSIVTTTVTQENSSLVIRSPLIEHKTYLELFVEIGKLERQYSNLIGLFDSLKWNRNPSNMFCGDGERHDLRDPELHDSYPWEFVYEKN